MSQGHKVDGLQPNSAVAVAPSTLPAAEPEQPQKGRRARRVSAKGRVSKVQSTPGRRSSIYRGVTRHRWTGRYEAHLWDKSCWNQSQNKKGRQGAYDDEEAAARAYDLAALKYWGPGTIINFPLSDYTKELEDMVEVSKEEYLASLRRKSSGFSRGVSKYRGVARHHHNGRWEARIGRIFGNKYLYLGTYSTQEEAAAAYDMAAIEYRGLNAVTNFDLSRYVRWLRPGQAGNVLPQVNSSDMIQAQNQTQESFLRMVPPAAVLPQVHDHCQQMEQQHGSQKWDALQACDEAYSQLANPSAQSKNASGSALGLLLQSGIFKQMLERTPVMDGHGILAQQTLLDHQSPEQSNSSCSISNLESHTCDQISQMDNNSIMDTMAVDHVKHELSFQEEERHVFDHTEMPALAFDQPEDLSFGPSSALDRMFYQSDIFPYLPVNPSPQAETIDQGNTFLDTVTSPFNSLYLPYAISTCS
ncbi:unnamed protein product [Calypogeia fissa]